MRIHHATLSQIITMHCFCNFVLFLCKCKQSFLQKEFTNCSHYEPSKEFRNKSQLKGKNMTPRKIYSQILLTKKMTTKEIL